MFCLYCRSPMDWMRLSRSGQDLSGTGGARVGPVTMAELAKVRVWLWVLLALVMLSLQEDDKVRVGMGGVSVS